MSDTEFFARIIISGIFKLGMLAWMTVAFGYIEHYPDLEGDLRI
jgi:hypothetical protein